MPDQFPAPIDAPPKPWDRYPKEAAQAYAAFTAYMLLEPGERSIDRAYWGSGVDQKRIGKRAPTQWRRWSTRYNWVSRANAYQEHLTNQDRILWEARRAAAKQRDWEQAEELRKIIDESLPGAYRFIRETVERIEAADGAPAKEIITRAFNIGDLARVLAEASKLQRLAVGETTENVGLSGAALDAAIDREIARRLETMAHNSQEGAFGEDDPDGSALSPPLLVSN